MCSPRYLLGRYPSLVWVVTEVLPTVEVFSTVEDFSAVCLCFVTWQETIKPKKSTLHHAPLADACANSLSFSCFSCLLLARALSLLDTLLDDRLRTLMLLLPLCAVWGANGLHLMDYGLYGSFVALHIPGLVGGTLLGHQHL